MEANPINELLIKLVEEASGMPVADIKPSSTFVELGMDSLDFILLINEIREHVGPITQAEATRCEKVSDLIDHFRS
jgi:acyl carrier protein